MKDIRPNAGAQTEFLSTSADIAITGGAAFGGKTFSLLLEAARHISNPKYQGIIFRRESVQITSPGGLRDTSLDIYPHLGGEYRAQPTPRWIFPSGAQITMAHLNSEDQVLAYQGSQMALICVEEGTPVLMGDSSYKNIEDIIIGDFVMTLEGSKVITKTFDPRYADCVSVDVFDNNCHYVGNQIHPLDHSILTSDGSWESYCGMYSNDASLLFLILESSVIHDQHISPLIILQKYLFPSQTSSCSKTNLEQQLELLQSFQDRLLNAVICEESTNEESLISKSCDALQDALLLLPLCAQVTLHEQRLQLDRKTLDCRLQLYEDAYALHESLSVDYLSSYSDDFCLCDEQLLDELNSAQYGLPLQDDAVSLDDLCLKKDVKDHIQKYNPDRQFEYDHPYRKERRLASVSVQNGSCFMTPIGKRKVYDLSVEQVNHYITLSRLVNKNCYDELCHFSKFQFFYMLSRSRSMSGIKPYIRGTCNPDPDSWVAHFISWWIDPDTGFPIKERRGLLRYMFRVNDEIIWADSKQELMSQYGCDEVDIMSVTFISSKATDNPLGLKTDPSYIGRLKALSKVERARLLDGNWLMRAQAGDYFPRDAITVIDWLPTDVVKWVRSWDLAATEEGEARDPDFTVGILIGRRSNGKIVIGDVVRVRRKANEVQSLIKNLAVKDGYDVWQSLPQDPGAAGKAEKESYQRLLQGFTVLTRTINKNKVLVASSGADSPAALWQRGEVEIVRANWNKDFLDECDAFPTKGVHDDQVDALSSGIRALPGHSKPDYSNSGLSGRFKPIRQSRSR